MKKRTATTWIFGATLAGLLATTLWGGLPACTPMEETASFYTHGVIAVTQQEQCVARADARVMRLRGVMDTWMRNRFFLFMKLENYLLSTRSEFGELWGENHNIQVLGAHVSYEYPSGLDGATETALSDTYYTAATGDVAPESIGVASIQAIPVEVGNALAADSIARTTGFPLLANVRLEGRLSDGTIVKSNVYSYPIDICFGCLYMVVTDDCTNLADAQDMRPPCLVGQDEGVDCRLFTLWGRDPGEIGF